MNLHTIYSTAREHGLTLTHVLALRLVAEAGTSTPTAVALHLGISPAAATGTVDRLELRGFVRRTTCQSDRRRSPIELTAKAECALEQVEAAEAAAA